MVLIVQIFFVQHVDCPTKVQNFGYVSALGEYCWVVGRVKRVLNRHIPALLLPP